MTTDTQASNPVKQALHLLARNNLLWKTVWQPMAKLGRHMTWQRSVMELRRLEAQLRPDYEVQAGPFKGLRYPQFKSIGSALLAKLLGTYEIELTEIMTHLIEGQYDVVVDVGCAEGFYAVGMALKIPAAKVFAFDISAEARELCEAMAKHNGVAECVTVDGVCTGARLVELAAHRRTLIISDCEGGELGLFDEGSLPGLRDCDVLVEVHDFIHRGVSAKLQERFRATHECQVVHSMNPMEKAERFPSPLIQEKNPEVLTWLYNEGRPEVMEWLFLTPRQRGGERADHP